MSTSLPLPTTLHELGLCKHWSGNSPQRVAGGWISVWFCSSHSWRSHWTLFNDKLLFTKRTYFVSATYKVALSNKNRNRINHLRYKQAETNRLVGNLIAVYYLLMFRRLDGIRVEQMFQSVTHAMEQIQQSLRSLALPTCDDWAWNLHVRATNITGEQQYEGRIADLGGSTQLSNVGEFLHDKNRTSWSSG
jgi:hypothetical protein